VRGVLARGEAAAGGADSAAADERAGDRVIAARDPSSRAARTATSPGRYFCRNFRHSRMLRIPPEEGAFRTWYPWYRSFHISCVRAEQHLRAAG
jgi:hypothetical protein